MRVSMAKVQIVDKTMIMSMDETVGVDMIALA